ncbi:hypothetical protein B0T25DRAFT_466744, partial [Lasiosphaeria hispida]
LLDLLISSAGCEASDPGDKVFALLGLIQDASHYGLAADYHLSAWETYTGIAAFFIQQHPDFRMLEYCHGTLRDPNKQGLPSWVPDWSSLPARSRIDWVPKEMSGTNNLQIFALRSGETKKRALNLPALKFAGRTAL